MDSRGKVTAATAITINHCLALEAPAKSIPLNSNTELTIYDCFPPLKVEFVSGGELMKTVSVERPRSESSMRIPPMEVHTFKGVGKGTAKLKVSDAKSAQFFTIEVK
jgi:hypothetical protein